MSNNEIKHGAIIKTKHYYRYENDEIVTINNTIAGTQILSSVAGFIYRLIDGKRTYNDILNCLTVRYQQVPYNELRKDLKDFLYSLKNYGFIVWKGINDEMGNGCHIVTEADYAKLNKYICKFLKEPDGLHGFVKINEPAAYSVYILRSNEFYLRETYFINESDDSINATVAYTGINSGTQTAALSFVIGNEISFICELIESSKASLKVAKISKVETLVPYDNNYSQVASLLESIGFYDECRLHKELYGNDVELFALYL